MRTDQIVTGSAKGPGDGFLLGNGHFQAYVRMDAGEDVILLRHVGFVGNQASFCEEEACRLILRQDLKEVNTCERSMNLRDGIAACSLFYENQAGPGVQLRSVYCMEDPKILCIHISDPSGMVLEAEMAGSLLTKTGAGFDRIFFEGRTGETCNLLGIVFAVSDGNVESSGGKLTIRGTEVMLFLAMDTDYAPDPREEAGDRWREILKKCVDTEIEKAVHGYLGGKLREAKAFTEPVSIQGEDPVSRQVTFASCLVRQLYSHRSPLPPLFWDRKTEGQAERSALMLHAALMLGMEKLPEACMHFLRFRMIGQPSGPVSAYGTVLKEDTAFPYVWTLPLLEKGCILPGMLPLLWPLREAADRDAGECASECASVRIWKQMYDEALREDDGGAVMTPPDAYIPLCLEKMPDTPVFRALGLALQGRGDEAFSVLQTVSLSDTCLVKDGEETDLCGTLAYALAVVSFLVRHTPDGLCLLPALPGAWESGCLREIRMGPWQIRELSWEHGRPCLLSLTGRGGEKITLHMKDRTEPLTLPENGQLVHRFGEEELHENK